MRLFSYSNLIAFLLMIVAVYLKARIEERLWIDHHKEYKEYLNSTKMIIPFMGTSKNYTQLIVAKKWVKLCKTFFEA